MKSNKIVIATVIVAVIVLIGMVLVNLDKVLDCFPTEDGGSFGGSSFPACEEEKVVAEKIERMESRLSVLDTATRDGIVTKSVTVYYLAASDGTVCEVGLSEYVSAKVGTKKTGRWVYKK